jgi:hypothetical protein
LHWSHQLLLLLSSHHLATHWHSTDNLLIIHALISVTHSSLIHWSLLRIGILVLSLVVEPLLATMIGTTTHLVILMIVVGTTSIIHLRIHRVTSSLLMAIDTHLESRFEEHCQQVN